MDALTENVFKNISSGANPNLNTNLNSNPNPKPNPNPNSNSNYNRSFNLTIKHKNLFGNKMTSFFGQVSRYRRFDDKVIVALMTRLITRKDLFVVTQRVNIIS